VGTITENMIFSSETINTVWYKGHVARGYNPEYVRSDRYGSLMERKEYGNRKSKYGWEIDHIIPLSVGGLNTMSNIQPLQWENNAAKSDKTR